MKTTTSINILLAAGTLAQVAAAQPHAHGHHHRRAEVFVTDVQVAYTTVVEYVTVSSSKASSSVKVTSKALRNKGHPKKSKTTTSAAASSTSSAFSTSKASSSISSSSAYSSAVQTTLSTRTSVASSSSITTSSRAPSSSSSAVSSSAGPKSTSSTGLAGYTGIKAGLSGYVSIQETEAFSQFAPHIGWYSDYSATTPDANGVQGIPMLWGDGTACSSVSSSRLTDFNDVVALATAPKIMFGFYEPDCDCPDSSDISDPATGLDMWNQYLKPLAARGTTLGSPSMCTQKDETWLSQFSGVSTSQELATWDVTSIHINKNSLQGAQEDVEYYVAKYGKPVWVTEFACVDDVNGFTPCSDQTEIDTFINDVVAFFQGNDSVVAYGPSNGLGLGDVWPMTDSSGALTATGQTYINAIKNL